MYLVMVLIHLRAVRVPMVPSRAHAHTMATCILLQVLPEARAALGRPTD